MTIIKKIDVCGHNMQQEEGEGDDMMTAKCVASNAWLKKERKKVGEEL